VKGQPTGTGLRPGSGDLPVLVSAALDGLAATLSVAALHAVRPADLLAFELVLRVTQADAPSPPITGRADPATVKMPALTAPAAGAMNDREGTTP
jgi:hypothetical protein